MSLATDQPACTDLEAYLPEELHALENAQTALPAIAKDNRLLAMIEQATVNEHDA